MTDKEFLDTFVTERMQMHYSSGHPRLTDDEIAAALQLEADYNQALESLPPKIASAIKNFHESVSDRLTKEGVFFYCKGIKSLSRNYKLCTGMILRQTIIAQAN